MNSKPMEVKKSRNNNPKLLSIAAAFEPATRQEGLETCANIRSAIEGWNPGAYEKTFGANVAAPYVLSRLCAMFKGLHVDVGGQEFYKITWEVVLKHKKSGHVITFYDYKGGISYGSDAMPEAAPRQFVLDAKKLLKALSDDRFPHPYDGCVIGEIA